MRVKILKRSFAGAEFAPDVRVLKVGGQSSAGVEKLEFELPAEWQGLSVTLHVQWLDGTLPAPVLLDDEDSVAVDKTLTASPGGQWMLLALGADGYRALTKPTKYECYSTLNTDGDVEISPTQYETFVARVLEYSNTAQQAAVNQSMMVKIPQTPQVNSLRMPMPVSPSMKRSMPSDPRKIEMRSSVVESLISTVVSNANFPSSAASIFSRR